MSAGATAMLVLVATVVGVEGETVRLDAGLIDGLRADDRGVVYYELSVGSTIKRVDVGSGRILEVDEQGAVAEIESERSVGTGYRVLFELPGDRLRPAELVRLARERLSQRPFDAVADRMLDALVPADPEIEERFIDLLERRRREREAAPESVVEAEPPAASEPEPRAAPEPALPVRVVMAVPGGSYRIGLPLAEARFFNQQPPFDVELRAFLIDRDPVRQEAFRRFDPDHPFTSFDPDAPMTAVTFEQARAFCESESGRLPTEFEWQVAVESGKLAAAGGLLEWTASWYKAYPGNAKPESAYGESFRVLRGASSPDDPDRHVRRYLDPVKRDARVGFRCVFPDEPLPTNS